MHWENDLTNEKTQKKKRKSGFENKNSYSSPNLIFWF